MLELVKIENKKGSQIHYQLVCDFCQAKSRISLDLNNTFFKARKDGWVTRYGTGATISISNGGLQKEEGRNAPAKWCCVQCVKKGRNLSTEERLQKMLSNLTEEQVNKICQE